MYDSKVIVNLCLKLIICFRKFFYIIYMYVNCFSGDNGLVFYYGYVGVSNFK